MLLSSPIQGLPWKAANLKRIRFCVCKSENWSVRSQTSFISTRMLQHYLTAKSVKSTVSFCSWAKPHKLMPCHKRNVLRSSFNQCWDIMGHLQNLYSWIAQKYIVIWSYVLLAAWYVSFSTSNWSTVWLSSHMLITQKKNSSIQNLKITFQPWQLKPLKC